MSETIRRLLTERQAADKLAVSPRTLQNWRRYGEGPRFVKLGAAVRYVEGDIDAWIDEQIRRSDFRSWPVGRLIGEGENMSSNIVEIHGQQATTTSLAIADGCKLKHKQVIAMAESTAQILKSLAHSRLKRGRVKPCHRADTPKQPRSLSSMRIRQTFLITLFRNSPIVRRFKLRLVKEFRRALNEIARLYANPPRGDIIKAKRAAHNPMMDALVEIREEKGKKTGEVHFMCENKLCNWVVTGRFAAIDESSLEQ
ncbi:MAG: helix-turn-helix domain-containing protein [Chromatiales bacterium]|nr:helix-turn-helix domain-containing protein [Chromatiales bacterium]